MIKNHPGFRGLGPLVHYSLKNPIESFDAIVFVSLVYLWAKKLCEVRSGFEKQHMELAGHRVMVHAHLRSCGAACNRH